MNSIAFNPAGRLLASGSTDGMVRLWNTVNGGLLFLLRGHESSLLAVGFNEESGTLVSISTNGLLKWWDTRDGQELGSLQTFDHPLRNAIFSQNGAFVAATGTAIRLLDTQTGEELVTISAESGIGSSMALSVDNTLLASSIAGNNVQIWQLK